MIAYLGLGIAMQPRAILRQVEQVKAIFPPCILSDDWKKHLKELDKFLF